MPRRRLLAVFALAYSVAHFAVTGVRQPLANFYGDFLASFPAWKVALLAGRLDFYEGSLAQEWGPPPIWHYGPVEHLITFPLFAFPTLRSAYVAWLMVCYLFVALSAAAAVWIIDHGRPTMTTALVAFVVFCNFNPLFEALTQRTIELFELVLLFAAYAFYRRERDGACGVAIGIAAMAKFLPLIYLPWFILRGRWKALAAALGVIVPVAIITQYVLGWENSGILLQLRHGGLLDSQMNQSLAGVVTRIVKWTQVDAAHAGVITFVILALAVGALSILLLRREGAADIEYGLLALAMVLLPPHNEQYYFVFLLIPYLFLYVRHRSRWSWRAALLGLSFLLVALPIPLSILGADAFGLYLRAGIPFLGAALLAVVLVADHGTSYAV